MCALEWNMKFGSRVQLSFLSVFCSPEFNSSATRLAKRAAILNSGITFTLICFTLFPLVLIRPTNCSGGVNNFNWRIEDFSRMVCKPIQRNSKQPIYRRKKNKVTCCSPASGRSAWWKPVTKVFKVLPEAAGFRHHFQAQVTVFDYFIFLR